MNNSLFISRCETVLTTMRSGNFQNVTVKQVAEWLEVNEPSASPIVAKLVKYNILEKVGSGNKTCYRLTESCHNSLETQLRSKDLIQSIKYVVNWFVNHPAAKAKTVITENGRKLVKIKSSEELDAAANNAITNLMEIINQNKELRVENELLKEEVEKLRMIEEKYKQIKSLMK